MTPEAFADHYPRLYHMTAAGGWEGIRANGLRTTRQLLADAGADAATVEAVAFGRRTEQVSLAPGVTIRDNLVLNEASLARALTGGLTPRDWYGVLNERAFLWANPKRLDRLLGGRAYRDAAHDVLTFETLPLAAAYADVLECTPMNTGAAFLRAAPRGRDTFTPLAEVPWEDWRKTRSRADAVVEVAVPGGVPDAARYLVEVHRRQHGRGDTVLWRR